MTQSYVSSQQRFTRNHPCPICDSHSNKRQGTSERCWGYLSSDGEFAFCARTDHAGNLELYKDTNTYMHKLYGECMCGKIHNPERNSSNGHKPQAKKATKHAPDFFAYDDTRAVAHFPYYDEQDNLLYVAVRYEWPDADNPKGHSKTVRQFHKEKGEWAPGIQGIRRVLYRLPDLLKADPAQIVYIVEGENKVEALRKLGLLATCNPMGAKKWEQEYSDSLKGHPVVILPDNDNDGREHAQRVATSLQGIAASVRTVTFTDLPEKGDIIDWLKAGGTKEELERLTKPPKRKFVYASEIEEQPIEWLWKRRIARGCFTLMVGDPGLGKSSIISKIIATVTNGGYLPDGNKIEPGGVILMSPEDSASKTIVPRLRAAGANLKKVLLLTEVEDFDSNGDPYMRPVSFPEDAHILEEAIQDAGASLAIIDPVLSMLSGKVDAHKDHAVRQALTRVVTVAEKQNCALLGVAHLNKGQNANALYRSSSSIAFIAMARTGLFVVPDPDNESGGVIVNHKNNLAPKAISLRYKFQQTDDEIGYITWEGESSYSETELLNQAAPTNNKRSEQADNLDAILRAHKEALTPEDIHPLLTSGQTLSALKMMLSRKVDNGEIMRVARGKYTFLGNPQYPVNDVTTVVNVNNVTNVNNEINNSNINNIDSDELPFSSPQPSHNGHKPAPQANTFEVGQPIRWKNIPVTIFKIGTDFLLVEDKDRCVKRINAVQFPEIRRQGVQA